MFPYILRINYRSIEIETCAVSYYFIIMTNLVDSSKEEEGKREARAIVWIYLYVEIYWG